MANPRCRPKGHDTLVNCDMGAREFVDDKHVRATGGITMPIMTVIAVMMPNHMVDIHLLRL